MRSQALPLLPLLEQPVPLLRERRVRLGRGHKARGSARAGERTGVGPRLCLAHLVDRPRRARAQGAAAVAGRRRAPDWALHANGGQGRSGGRGGQRPTTPRPRPAGGPSRRSRPRRRESRRRGAPYARFERRGRRVVEISAVAGSRHGEQRVEHVGLPYDRLAGATAEPVALGRRAAQGGTRRGQRRVRCRPLLRDAEALSGPERGVVAAAGRPWAYAQGR